MKVRTNLDLRDGGRKKTSSCCRARGIKKGNKNCMFFADDLTCQFSGK